MGRLSDQGVWLLELQEALWMVEALEEELWNYLHEGYHAEQGEVVEASSSSLDHN